MSTKTLRKRIALVAVSALGFGLMSSAPSSAGAGDEIADLQAITSALVTGGSATVGITTAANFDITLTSPAVTAANADTATIYAAVTSAPVGGGATVVWTRATAGTTPAITANITPGSPSGQKVVVTYGGNISAAVTGAVGKLAVTPDTAGSYVVTVWHDKNRDGIFTAGETSRTIAVTATSAGAVLANQIPNSADATAGADSSLNGVKVSSVGVEVVQVSGRTGIQVGFAPQYRLTRNAGTITAANEVPTMAAKFATISYSVTNPAGTAVTVVSAQGGATASTSQAIAGLATPGLDSTTADIARTQAISNTTGWPQRVHRCSSQQQLLVLTQSLRSTMRTLILW